MTDRDLERRCHICSMMLPAGSFAAHAHTCLRWWKYDESMFNPKEERLEPPCPEPQDAMQGVLEVDCEIPKEVLESMNAISAMVHQKYALVPGSGGRPCTLFRRREHASPRRRAASDASSAGGSPAASPVRQGGREKQDEVVDRAALALARQGRYDEAISAYGDGLGPSPALAHRAGLQLMQQLQPLQGEPLLGMVPGCEVLVNHMRTQRWFRAFVEKCNSDGTYDVVRAATFRECPCPTLPCPLPNSLPHSLRRNVRSREARQLRFFCP